MRFLYNKTHGAQLFEEDGVDHTKDGWHDHPEKAGLVPLIDPNGPTHWVHPSKAPKATAAPTAEPEASHQEPVWVDIPADWEELHWTKQVKLASEIAGEEVKGKPAAIEIITAELARRQG